MRVRNCVDLGYLARSLVLAKTQRIWFPHLGQCPPVQPSARVSVDDFSKPPSGALPQIRSRPGTAATYASQSCRVQAHGSGRGGRFSPGRRRGEVRDVDELFVPFSTCLWVVC